MLLLSLRLKFITKYMFCKVIYFSHSLLLQFYKLSRKYYYNLIMKYNLYEKLKNNRIDIKQLPIVWYALDT